jgi:hypothetical protein
MTQTGSPDPRIDLVCITRRVLANSFKASIALRYRGAGAVHSIKSRHLTVYSITSSARLSTDEGAVMPSVFAVLRLMSSSILLAYWTGKSAGFSPLRMRPTYPPARR